jgi:N-methylhydantoinase B
VDKVNIKVDPVMTEIVRHGLLAITEEMKANLMRTAYNVIIYEALDFTVGLFDRNGDTLSIGIGLPMFIRGMSETVKAKLAHFGEEKLEEGDVLVTNDAYTTGSHLNHVTLTVPIFFAGRLIGFSSCMAHWQDIGGALHGMTTDIYSEGLQIPFTKLISAGQVDDEMMAIIAMNVRIPERAMGDLRAQIAAVQMGERRFLELVKKYGDHNVQTSIAAILAQSDAAAREKVKGIPDGVYEAESFMDDDGVTVGKRIPIRVKVLVSGETMTVDLSGISEQVTGFYNSGRTAGVSCAQVAFKCLTSPTELPINDGTFRSLNVILPVGTVVSAVRPAAMRWWMTYPMTVVDTILKALAPAMPQRVAAGHHADLCSCHISGYHPQDGKLFLASVGLIGGGWGAKYCEDGASATICINDGDTHNAPCELTEAKFPLRIESYALRPDSGGAGRYRGGLGTEKVIRALGDIVMNVQMDRVHNHPFGLAGGLSGQGNQVALRRGNLEEVPANGKLVGWPVAANSSYVLRSGGGGGYGSPLERTTREVREDVRQGYVSRHAARESYGVVIEPATGVVDEAATMGLRITMRPCVEPHDIACDAEHGSQSGVDSRSVSRHATT